MHQVLCFRRMAEAVRGLVQPDVSQLCRQIALNRLDKPGAYGFAFYEYLLKLRTISFWTVQKVIVSSMAL